MIFRRVDYTIGMKKRVVRIVVFAILALLVGAGVAYYQGQVQSARVVNKASKENHEPVRIAGLQLGGPFTLLNQDGEKVTEQSYAGMYKLIYFGFTYCPAICPTELQKMRQVMNGLPADVAARIQPIFVTTDPERDTPEVMKKYISLFDPRLEGLTGTRPQIDQILNAYRIFAVKVVDEANNDYTMDHSSFTYLMAPDGVLVDIYRMQDTADFMVADIAENVGKKE